MTKPRDRGKGSQETGSQSTLGSASPETTKPKRKRSLVTASQAQGKAEPLGTVSQEAGNPELVTDGEATTKPRPKRKRVTSSQGSGKMTALVTSSRQLTKPAESPSFLVELSPEITKLLGEAYQDNALQGLIDLYRSGALQTLLEWQTRAQGISPKAPERRPLFRGKRRNTGVNLSEEILRRAQEKAKSDRARTGGSVSQLVEWLLWRYLGSPLDLVERSAGEPENK